MKLIEFDITWVYRAFAFLAPHLLTLSLSYWQDNRKLYGFNQVIRTLAELEPYELWDWQS